MSYNEDRLAADMRFLGRSLTVIFQASEKDMTSRSEFWTKYEH